jgi:hypothetical protein
MRSVPNWCKYTYTALLCAFGPIYFFEYGPRNFLWFSNIALVATLLAIVFRSRLLLSMMAVGVALLEFGWNVLFWSRLLFGWEGFGALDYMFDERIGLWARLLSLYHVPLPFVLVWLVWKEGYDARALRWQTLFAWAVLIASYLLVEPWQNINFVYGPLDVHGRPIITPPYALLIAMAVLPLCVYWPSHAIFKRIGGRGATA